jgi:antitoxin HigA-1
MTANNDRIAPIHPGEILQEEFMDPLALTAYRVAKELGVQQTRLSQILRGERGITAETALLLGRYFRVSPQFWLNLQASYDLRQERERLGDRLERIRPHGLAPLD